MDFQKRPVLAALMAATLCATAGISAARSHDDGVARVDRLRVDAGGRLVRSPSQQLPWQFAQAVAPPLNGGQPNVGLSGGTGSAALSGGQGSVALSGGSGVMVTPLPAPLPPQSIRPNPFASTQFTINGRPTPFTGALSGMPGPPPGLSGAPGLTPSRPGLTPLGPTPFPGSLP